MIQSLFISKNLTDVPELAQFCQENAIQLHAVSLIQFKPLAFEYSQKCDCIFFSSPRSAHFFLSKQTLSNELIAVAGETTKRSVESFGYSVEFVPENSGMVTQSSKQFAEWLGTKTVLFPVSTISNKSYSSDIPENQVCCIEIYETELAPQHIAVCDVYVFTSPSNVQSFLEKNALPKNGTIIAWGESTNDALKRNALNNSEVLQISSQQALIEKIRT